MNCDSGFVPKNALITLLIVRALTRSCGVRFSLSRMFIRSRIVRAMRARPMLNCCGDLLADRPHAAVAEMIDIIDRALLLLQFDQVIDDRDDVLLGQRGRRHRDVETELAVDAVAADVAEIVPLLVEEEAVDEGLGRLEIGRIARAELLVDGRRGHLLRSGRCP